jgi:hypothetical protein
MASIQADIEGLTALGASCHHHAGAMRAGYTTPSAGEPFQATSAAVAEVHMNADAAEQSFVERLIATGNTVRAVARGFAVTDARSTGTLAAVAETV